MHADFKIPSGVFFFFYFIFFSKLRVCVLLVGFIPLSFQYKVSMDEILLKTQVTHSSVISGTVC